MLSTIIESVSSRFVSVERFVNRSLTNRSVPRFLSLIRPFVLISSAFCTVSDLSLCSP